MVKDLDGNVFRMTQPLPGSEKREKGILNESLRSPRKYPNFLPKPELGGAALGLINSNFYFCEQTKQYFAKSEGQSRVSIPNEGGKVAVGSNKEDIGSKMSRVHIQEKPLENVSSRNFSSVSSAEDGTAGYNSTSHSTVIKETKFLNSSESLFSVSCDPKLFSLPSQSPTCHFCGLHGSQRCGQCKQAYYCSEICQKKDWCSHGVVCKPIKLNKTEDHSLSTGEAVDVESNCKVHLSPVGVSRTESGNTKRVMLSDLQKIDLKKGIKIQGTILGFKSPSEFYVQLYSVEVAKYLSNVTLALKETYSSMTVKELYNPIKGEVCVAKYSQDQGWYRVLVRDVDTIQKKSKLLFIDFGNEEEAMLDNIHPLLSNIVLYPPAAVRCSVANILPVQGVWTQECISAIRHLLFGQYCSFTVVSVELGETLCCTVDVIIASSGKRLDNVLVEMEYACRQNGSPKKENSNIAPHLDTFVAALHEKRDARKINSALTNDQLTIKLISLSVGEVFPAVVTDVQTPEEFFCQQVKRARQLSELQAALSAHYTITPPCGNFSPAVGDVCCAKFTEDNNWYRASLLRYVSDNSALVGYVDYGNFEVLSIARLRPILPRFLELPLQAIRCALADVKPPSGTWTVKAISMMKQKVSNKIITVKVVSRMEDTPLVEIIDEAAVPVLNVSKYLIESGCAAGGCKTSIPADGANEVEKNPHDEAVKNVWSWSNLTVNQKTDVTVCALYSPGEFYCQIYREEDLCALNELNKLLAKHCQTTSNSTAKLAKGDVCSAFFSGDGNWYRGLVKEIATDGTAKVHFVDYGNIEDVAVDKLRMITTLFLELPFQGIRCWLSDVKPVNEHWTPEATAKLQMFVTGIKLQAHAVCITEDGVGVELVDNNSEHPQIISELLIREKLALKKGHLADEPTKREPAGTLGNLLKMEPNSKSDRPSSKELSSKFDLPAKKEPGSKFDILPTREQTSTSNKLSTREQNIKYDTFPTREQSGKCDVPPKRDSGSNFDMAPKRESGGKFDMASSGEPSGKCEGSPMKEQSSTFDMSAVRQMPQLRESGSKYDILSRKEPSSKCKMPPNGQPYNACDIQPMRDTPVYTLLEGEPASETDFISKKEPAEKRDSQGQGGPPEYFQKIFFLWRNGCSLAGNGVEYLMPLACICGEIHLKCDLHFYIFCVASRWKTIELPVNEATPVRVLKVESPDLFYAFPKGNKVDKEKLQWTMIELAEYCSTQKNHNYTPMLGEACCARYTGDNHWYRAVVLAISESTVKVAYADYGNAENLHLSRVLPIKASLLGLPFQIIRCSLAGVMPHTREWSSSAVDCLKGLILDQVVSATVLRIGDDIHALSVEKQDNEGMINVADKLIIEGLAICSNSVNPGSPVTGERDVCCCKELRDQVGKLQKEVEKLEQTVFHLSRHLEKKELIKMRQVFEE